MNVLQDAMDDLAIRRIASYCPTSPEFIDLVNRSVRRSMRRGDFVGTTAIIYVCTYNGCVVWPRYVQNVRKLSYCHNSIPVKNQWYSFMEGVCNRTGSWTWNGLGGNWVDSQGLLLQQGRSSLFQDIQGDGRLVRAYVRCPNDEGKTVTIFGVDNNGQPLQTQNLDGSYSMGVILTLPDPTTQFVSTNQYVRSIDYVLKDETECPVGLYAYNASTNLLEDLAQYDPSETRPSYEKTKLSAANGFGNAGCCSKGVLALVKLKYYPAKNPTDILYIDNLDALQFMIQSCKLGEAGDINGSRAMRLESVNELNRQLEDESPDDTFSANNATFGPATFTNQCF